MKSIKSRIVRLLLGLGIVTMFTTGVHAQDTSHGPKELDLKQICLDMNFSLQRAASLQRTFVALDENSLQINRLIPDMTDSIKELLTNGGKKPMSENVKPVFQKIQKNGKQIWTQSYNEASNLSFLLQKHQEMLSELMGLVGNKGLDKHYKSISNSIDIEIAFQLKQGLKKTIKNLKCELN